MLDQIRLLIQLQAVDKTMFVLQQEAEKIPVRLAELSLDQDRLQQALDARQAELDQVAARRKDLETNGEGVRSRLRKADSRLMGAKTQREYRAASAEIDEGKDALKATDDMLLEVMERHEALEKQVAKLKEQLAQVSAQVDEERQTLTKRAQEITNTLSQFVDNRQSMADQVEKTLLREYDFIRTRRQGVALAAVRSGTCQVCHMDIPPQQFNELQRLNKIMTCQSCKRLLYWADAEQLADLT
jgi:predicted  nucleic acid-binding Zn-ribbon protein